MVLSVGRAGTGELLFMHAGHEARSGQLEEKARGLFDLHRERKRPGGST